MGRVSRREAEEDSVILLRTPDALRARMVKALLEEEGIVVSTPGLEHNSMLLFAGSAIEVIVRVPRRDLERATALVAEMEREVEAAPDPDGGAPYRDGPSRAVPLPRPRLKRIAVVATVLFPGGGHFYVQRPWRALLVVAGYAAAIGAIAWSVPLSGYLLLLPLIADVLGAFDGCDVSAGKPATSPHRLAPVVALAVIGAWSVLAPGPLLPWLAGHEGAARCEWVARCEGVDAQLCLLNTANEVYDAVPGPCASCTERVSDCSESIEVCAEVCGL